MPTVLSTLRGFSLAVPLFFALFSNTLAFDRSGWRTDFSKHAVPLEEILPGGPPKDGIPSIDRPRFESVTEANRSLEEKEPVLVYVHRGDARAYPLRILLWHEIVNDEVGGRPVAVTFCPLCNTAIVFDRRVDGRVLDFGTTGNLRHSDLVMYDRQTESWWQQATGEAIVGELVGRKLTFLPARTTSWKGFREAFPEGKVLSRETGYARAYGRNPYPGYDRLDRPYFPVPGTRRLPMMARVVVVQAGSSFLAVPFDALRKSRVLDLEVGGTPVVLFYEPGTRSALDDMEIRHSREVGSVAVFRRRSGERTLTFRALPGGTFADAETGSVWTVNGRALSGPLEGGRLEPVVHFTPFWFAWAAFRPETPVYGLDTGEEGRPGRTPESKNGPS
ncbi:MAG: hypothetical protein KatS3mg076_2004 [Candidatus Binatia bacterium]|nr:MAG: hypothetical protein KatS3mg076_2004 [Candidatus Binatia bacterium]